MNSFWVELLEANVYPLAGRYRTRVIEAGEGEPLVLLHGTGGRAENFAPLSRRHRVIAVDCLWHGRSQADGFDSQILPPLVDQVRDVLDTLKIDRAHIEGKKNFIPPAVGQRLARQIPNARFFCVAATGHWAQFENFEVHNREVLRFLAEKETVS